MKDVPHQCVACGAFYPDKSDQIITGCACGAKLFFYVKKGREALVAEQRQAKLSAAQRTAIQDDVYALIGAEVDRTKPVVLDFESIRVTRPGTYELDLTHLFAQRRPIVFKIEEGKYVVDLAAAFTKQDDVTGRP